MTQIAPGTPRYFAWLYSDARLQAILAPLFGIESEIGAALQPGLEHSVAHVRMTWWAEEAERLRGGHALHPLSRALLAQRPAGTGTTVAGPDVSGLVDTATWDLARATFESRRELLGYCGRWAQALPQLASAWGVPQMPPALAAQFGQQAGTALCELEMLLTLQAAARLGRLRVPLDELARAAVPPEALASTPWPAGLCEHLRLRHRALRAALDASGELLTAPAHRTALRGLLVWIALAQRHSQRAESALPHAWQRSRRDGIGDAVLAWRAARRAMKSTRQHP